MRRSTWPAATTRSRPSTCGTTRPTSARISPSSSTSWGNTSTPSFRSTRRPRPQQFWNLQLYDLIGKRFQFQTFTQYYVDDPFNRKSAAQTTFLTANYAFPHSYISATGSFTNYNLLTSGSFNAPSNSPNVGAQAHPTSLQLTWTSFNNRIGKLPLYEQTYFGYGFNHDSVGQQYGTGPNATLAPGNPAGLQEYGGYTYYTIYNTLIGYTLSTPSFKFGNLDNAYNTYYFNASVNAQRQWYTVPHHINTTTTTGSISRQFTRALGAYVAYQIQNTNDLYENGGYESFIPTSNPAADCGAVPPPSDCDVAYGSFRGAATLRTLNFELNYLPNPDFNFSLLARKHNDFPAPFPNGNVFQTPLKNPIGQPHQLQLSRPAAVRHYAGSALPAAAAHAARHSAYVLLQLRQSEVGRLRYPGITAMIKRTFASLGILALCFTLMAAAGPIVATGQLLAYQDGYVFFTTGDAFHVAPNVVIHDAVSGGPTTIVPGPRIYARATFDPSGTVTELDLSRRPLPPRGQLGRRYQVRRGPFAGRSESRPHSRRRPHPANRPAW